MSKPRSSRARGPEAGGPAGLEVVWPGKYDAQGNRVCTPVSDATLRVDARYPGEGPGGRLLCGDNLAAMDALLGTAAGSVDLCYIDPPFSTGNTFDLIRRVGSEAEAQGSVPELRSTAYRDAWEGGDAGFMAMLDPRLRRIHQLLAPHGSLYVHVDPTVGHAVKLLLDEIFGPGCFQREIVWRIGWVSGFKTRARNWIRNHDVIYFYTKDPKRFTFNKHYTPHPEGYRRRDGAPPKGPGMPMEDVWNANESEFGLRGSESLDSIQIKSFSTEKSGWATQKNESLVRRVVEASSNPGDLVLDVFCGSGTTALAAARTGRRFVGCDASADAVHIARKRLSEAGFSVVTEVVQPAGTGSKTPGGSRAPVGDPTFEVEVDRTDGGWSIALTGYRFRDPGELPDDLRPHLEPWTQLVDAWDVQAGSGGIFEPTQGAFRTYARRELAFEARFEGTIPAQVAVQVVDIAGGQTRRRFEIDPQSLRVSEMAERATPA